MKKQLLIAGGTGLIGTAILQNPLFQDWQITILSRYPGKDKIVWRPDEGIIEMKEDLTFDAIVNLAGASITEGRWTEKRKIVIYQSRIQATNTLYKYVREGRIKTSVYLGVSGIGIYGDHKLELVDEVTTITDTEDWFIKTCIDWEKSHEKFAAVGIRTIILRLGIVLSTKGGALKEILDSPGFGVLSYFGDGQQIWPWIHIDDLSAMIFFCLGQHSMSGTFIAASPNPVTNKKLTRVINTCISTRRILMGVPKILVSIVLGEMHRVLLESCNTSSAKMLKQGFIFRFPEINEALQNLFGKD